jgi:hypothetical protein
LTQAFPKGTKTPTVYNNNFYGKGSGALRVYTQTVNTFGTNVDEIQTITTVAAVGQTLGGGFHLTYRGNRTALILHNAEPIEVERAIESSFHWAGDVVVTRSLTDGQVHLVQRVRGEERLIAVMAGARGGAQESE